MKIRTNRFLKLFICLMLVLTITTLAGCKKKEKNPDDNKIPSQTTDFLDLSTRDYVGKNGVVAAANPYAAKAGLDILEAGGNAFDAAVAVSFALGVVEPNASGVGGGGIMVGYDATLGEYVSYNFREFVPKAGTAKAFGTDARLDGGITASGVPTQVAGLLGILEDKGVKTRQEVLAPAIKYANEGVKIMPELATAINDNFSKIMISESETLEVFSDGFAPLTAGSLLVQKDYANVLQRIADNGAAGFYTGETANAIVDLQEANGGFITHDDLLYAMNNYPKKTTPVMGTYRGYEIASANTPSSGGIILIEALNMLEVYGDIAALGHNSAEYINVVATAMQLAYGDKRNYIADSAFVDVPIQGLISKQYAAERWQKYTPGKAYLGRNQGDNDYGNPWKYTTKTNVSHDEVHDYHEHYSTTAFSVTDKQGNIVSVTQTINYFFGNGQVPENCGFFLNNELSSFSLNTSSVHYVEPYKQPVSHIMPTIVTKDGNPYATLGSPGSMRIPAAVLQTLINMIDFGMNMQDAIAAPRVYSYAVSSSDHSASAKDLYVENAITKEVQNQLDSMGYYVIPYGTGDINLYFGGVQGIKFNEDGTMHGGADPRRDGKALGY